MPEGPREIWRSAGLGLLDRTESGHLSPTEAFLRAYFVRPELQPVEESCAAELRLHEALMAEPLRPVGNGDLEAIRDADAVDNYRAVLAFRDHLIAHPTLEAAYMSAFSGDVVSIPPIMLDHLVHAVLANLLSGMDDPFRARTAELFFREQTVMTGDGVLMLADAEMLELHAASAGSRPVGGPLAEAEAARREVTFDVLTEENAALYWQRADRYDMAVDFRFTEPALDAFARNLELWLSHLLSVETRIQPQRKIEDSRWTWHVGLDVQATRILNALYDGQTLDEEVLSDIVALFRLDWLDRRDAVEGMADKPVYLGLAKRRDGILKMKPQNLLTNLPLAARQ